jgi:hypothetical protein
MLPLFDERFLFSPVAQLLILPLINKDQKHMAPRMR